MKGTLRARATWTAQDRPGRDTCKLWQEPGGWILIGHAWFLEKGVEAVLDYVVRCDDDWVSHSADVTGTLDGRSVGWRLWRTSGGWLLNDVPVAGSANCLDLDLGFTPATNLLPIRRLDPAPGQTHPVRALWLRIPEGRARVHPQTYERLDDRRVRYGSPGYSVDLDVHPSGFVRDYPEGWRGEVRDG